LILVLKGRVRDKYGDEENVKAGRRKNVGREREGNRRGAGNEEEKQKPGVQCAGQTWGDLEVANGQRRIET
jgi:hypothetical protein